jgi:hypothetical protein
MHYGPLDPGLMGREPSTSTPILGHPIKNAWSSIKTTKRFLMIRSGSPLTDPTVQHAASPLASGRRWSRLQSGAMTGIYPIWESEPQARDQPLIREEKDKANIIGCSHRDLRQWRGRAAVRLNLEIHLWRGNILDFRVSILSKVKHRPPPAW